MSIRFVCLLIGFVLIVLAACAPKAVPEVQPQVSRETGTAQTETAKTGWQADWDKIVQAANEEGRVVIFAQAEPASRDSLIAGFNKEFPGIAVEYTGMSGSAMAAKITAERRAGLYTVDMDIHGTTTALSQLRPFAVPIKPLLILPEVRDPKYWRGNKLDFADEGEEINLVMVISINPGVGINTDLVNLQEFTSWWDMTKPKWKGKIIAHDPRFAGVGLASATFWYLHPELGMDFIKAFAANQPVLSQDRRLIVETVARGKYSIALGPADAFLDEFVELGMPIRMTNMLKEGTFESAGWASLVAMDKAPHPNARTVFLNWLLGKEGQTRLARSSGYASRRLDVPTDHLKPWAVPDPKANYLPSHKEKYVNMRDEIVQKLKEVFP